MRIIPWGGSEELWYRTAKLAILQGHTVYTLTQRWDDAPEQIFALSELGSISTFFNKPTYSLIERVKIKARLQQQVAEVISFVDADVYVISNGTTFDFTRNRYIMEQVAKSGKPYLLISQHNFENGHIVSQIDRSYAINVLQRSAKNFFVSARNLECAERQLAHKIGNSLIISNPVTINDVTIKPFPVSEKLLIAFVARLDCGVKGQDILLQALSGDIWKERNFALSFYGTGPDFDYLHQLVNFYGLEAKVTFKGHVKNVDQIWESNQVLILSSLNEGTPLALVEAMLSGRAAVATNVGDNNRYVLDGETGFLASAAALECLDYVLEKLWFNRHNLQIMGMRAFAHALEITDLEPEKLLLNTIKLASEPIKKAVH